jgi:hypothetical protein
MFKKILIGLLLYSNISYANENVLDKYSLTLEEIPVACGHRLTVEQYLKDFNFELINMSVGRSAQQPTGEIVFLAEYYINKKNTETVVILSSPDDHSTACIGYRSFDLKQGVEIRKYLMRKNRQ